MLTKTKNLLVCLKSKATERFMSVAVILVFSGIRIMAQDVAGKTAFSAATQTIKGYQTEVRSLLYAIACVICLVGAFNVYFKMQNGDQDVKKTIMMTMGGCIAFVALAEALPAFFGG